MILRVLALPALALPRPGSGPVGDARRRPNAEGHGRPDRRGQADARRRTGLQGPALRRPAGGRAPLEAAGARPALERRATGRRLRPQLPAAQALRRHRSVHPIDERGLPLSERLDGRQGGTEAAGVLLDPRRRLWRGIGVGAPPRRRGPGPQGRGGGDHQLPPGRLRFHGPPGADRRSPPTTPAATRPWPT